MLTFEEYKEIYFNPRITEELKKDLEGLYSLDAKDELERLAKQEYKNFLTLSINQINNVKLIEDLEFIKEVLEELSVNEQNYEFGHSYQIAKDRKKLAEIKLNRLIREEKLKINPM